MYARSWRAADTRGGSARQAEEDFRTDRRGRPLVGRRTYLRVAGIWKYLYRAIDQFGQVIDVILSDKRDISATRRIFHRALVPAAAPVEVTTDEAIIYPAVIDELAPQPFHDTKKYPKNRCEARLRTAQISVEIDARPQNRRDHQGHRHRARLLAEHSTRPL